MALRACLCALFLAIFAGPTGYTGCATPPSGRVAQVQTLKAVGHSAEAAVSLAANLYAAKRITAEQARQVMALYDVRFQPAFRLAVAAANANLDSFASPDLVGLAAQLTALVASFGRASP